MTDLALIPADIQPSQPTVTTTSAVDSWTVHLGPVNATIRYLHDAYEDGIDWSYVSVDNALAESVDPQLAALAEQERNLGDDRWLPRDLDKAVDDFYDRLNERIGAVQTMIAAAVLPKLGAILDTHPRLLDKVEFDAYAGCASCKCSPGVKAPFARRYGTLVHVDISAA